MLFYFNGLKSVVTRLIEATPLQVAMQYSLVVHIAFRGVASSNIVTTEFNALIMHAKLRWSAASTVYFQLYSPSLQFSVTPVCYITTD